MRACLCRLVHDLIFVDGCEERMVFRLQQESSPREAATLEGWFLDTLLEKHGIEAAREEILESAAQGPFSDLVFAGLDGDIEAE